MRLHYVEHDILDQRLMAGLFDKDRSIILRSSHRMSDFVEDGEAADLDCVLLDVFRPDSLSMEDDVVTVRRRTKAPIIFVTGADAQPIRQSAVDAGADGVLEKSILSKDIILQFTQNAIARTRSEYAATFRTPSRHQGLVKPKRSDSNDGNQITSLAPITSLLRSELGRLQAGDSNGISVQREASICRLAETAKGLDSLVQSDPSRSEEVDIREVCAAAQIDVEAFARNRGITVVWDVRSARYLQQGSFEQGVEAIKHLCLGVIESIERGGVVMVAASQDVNGGGAHLQVFGAELYLPEGWSRFESEAPKRRLPLEAQASLSLAMHLFGASPASLSLSRQASTAVLSLILV